MPHCSVCSLPNLQHTSSHRNSSGLGYMTKLSDQYRVRLLDLGVFFGQVKGIGELLEGLIPYSQRHFNRMDRFVRSSFLLDYTLGEMSVIDPKTDTEYPKDKKIEEETREMEQEPEADQKTPSRKRKSQKSKDRSSKKRLVAEAQGNVIAV